MKLNPDQLLSFVALVQFRHQYQDIEIFVDSGNSQQVIH